MHTVIVSQSCLVVLGGNIKHHAAYHGPQSTPDRVKNGGPGGREEPNTTAMAENYTFFQSFLSTNFPSVLVHKNIYFIKMTYKTREEEAGRDWFFFSSST